MKPSDSSILSWSSRSRCLPSILSLLSVALLCGGCATQSVKFDEQQLRNVFMQYFEDQVLDNVIRAKRGYPIVQFDLNKADATLSTSLSGTFAGGQSISNTTSHMLTNQSVPANTFSEIGAGAATVGHTVTNTLAAVLGGGSTIMRPATFSGMGSRGNQVDVQMLPVTDKNEVYEAYEDFLKWDKGRTVRDSVHNHDQFPPPKLDAKHLDDENAVHVGKWVNGVYYWVPQKYSVQYFNLCLVTTVKRTSGTASVVDAPAGAMGGKPMASASVSQSNPALPKGLQSTASSLSPSPASGPSVSQSNPNLPPGLKSSASSPGPSKAPGDKALQDTADELRLLRLALTLPFL